MAAAGVRAVGQGRAHQSGEEEQGGQLRQHLSTRRLWYISHESATGWRGYVLQRRFGFLLVLVVWRVCGAMCWKRLCCREEEVALRRESVLGDSLKTQRANVVGARIASIFCNRHFDLPENLEYYDWSTSSRSPEARRNHAAFSLKYKRCLLANTFGVCPSLLQHVSGGEPRERLGCR